MEEFMKMMMIRDYTIQEKLKEAIDNHKDIEDIDTSDLIKEEKEYLKREIEKRRLP